MDLHNCSTAVKKESLFYKNWTVEIAMLRAESELWVHWLTERFL